MPSLVTIAEVRALVPSRLSDGDLQVVIDREEAWLVGKVGALTGERTDTFSPGGATSLYLRRLTGTVVLTDDGVTLAAGDFLFTPSTGELRRYPLAGWRGTVTAKYTPGDTAAVKRAVIELVRGTVGETGMDSETIDGYSYTRGESAGRVGRAGLARSILLSRPAYSMRIRAGWEPS